MGKEPLIHLELGRSDPSALHLPGWLVPMTWHVSLRSGSWGSVPIVLL